MTTATATTDQERRVELILQQIDSLPTLAPVAVRLLDLTTADDSNASDVIAVVASDPSLAGKVIRLCRCDARGRAASVTTVDRAVTLLGFDAVRSAALSVQVFELLDHIPSVGGERRGERAVFDRRMFWHHSLAVGIAAERLAAARGGSSPHVNPAEAFLAGLLHDLGQLALHVALPATFDRVCDMAEARGISLDNACRRVIGMDTHTAGKRLAEHWRLPFQLIDVLWLNGQPFRSLPELPHRRLIGIVTLADAIARRQHITPAGHAPRGEPLQDMCRDLNVDEQVVFDLVPKLHEEVNLRAEALGLKAPGSPDLLLQSISRANEVLGRTNTALRQRTIAAVKQAAALRSIAAFHSTIEPGLSVVAVLGKIIHSASEVLGEGAYSMLYKASDRDPWQLLEFSPDGRLISTRVIQSDRSAPTDREWADDSRVSVRMLDFLPKLKAHLAGVTDSDEVQLLPLRCGWGISAILVHDAAIENRLEREPLEAVTRTWGAAVASAQQHAGARRLGEQLAQANRALMETQDELARSRVMATLGEVAAGAAHEMNNPLTVISGRSQLLASRLQDEDLRTMAEQIVDKSHVLSDMISALRLFAEPVEPNFVPVDLRMLLERVLRDLRPRIAKAGGGIQIDLQIEDGIGPVFLDPEQIALAVKELVLNALEARPERQILVRVQTDATDGRLMIQVTDDGPGMSEHVLAHAFDPFFSAKPAGRQPGLGLARARHLIEAHGGQVTLRNAPGGGAVATIRIPDCWGHEEQQRGAA